MDTRSASAFRVTALLICSILASPAFALSARVFVSAQNGTAGCSGTLSSPCRQIAKALTLVQQGGEIIVLDSGGFNSFTIGKSVSIIAPEGVYAGVTAGALEDAIAISAGASDTIVIRGLTVKGTSASGYGIRIIGDSTVHVESCVIEGFNQAGGFLASAAVVASGASRVFLKDTVARDSAWGLEFLDSVAVVEHCKLDNNVVAGLGAAGSAKVTIRDSELSGNGIGAFVTNASEVNMENCVVSGNATAGVEAVSIDASIARVSNSVITGNGIGLSQEGGGALFSRVNNTVEGNTTDTQGSIETYIAK